MEMFNINESLYFIHQHNDEALKDLINYYRPMVTALWNEYLAFRQVEPVLRREYYTYADVVLMDCINQFRGGSSPEFNAYYRKALRNRTFDLLRVLKSSSLFAYDKVAYLDMKVNEAKIDSYCESVDDKDCLNEKVITKLQVEWIFNQLSVHYDELFANIFKYRYEGYTIADISKKTNVSATKVRTILNKIAELK